MPSLDSRPITTKQLVVCLTLAATVGGALATPITWMVALSTRVAVLETKVFAVEKQLDSMNGKLDKLLEIKGVK